MATFKLNSGKKHSYTWSTKPAANAFPIGVPVYISDVGVGGSTWITDGTNWYPQGGKLLLAQNSNPISITGTLNDQTGPSGTARAIITVPANMLLANGSVEVETLFSYTNSANAKNLRVRFGGMSGTVYLNTPPTNTACVQNTCFIRNANATNSQKGFLAAASNHFGSSSGTTTSTIDTTSAVDVLIGGQLTNIGETITLESYAVWIRPSA